MALEESMRSRYHASKDNWNFENLNVFDPRGQPTVCDHVASVRPSSLFNNSQKNNKFQISSMHSDRYWQECGSGRGDHL